ncbi:MAG TPA: cytochrome b N-terminal domain-containing protein [Ktedonobacterales bacterium]|jgi:quinol-cytochrome oxidoreductase complex cytochrome b subunit|nr:cytochrome b N-terminal domain-containing protein [Ktedonobacterales bacterium]
MSNWTLTVRRQVDKHFPNDQLLPDQQPAFVRSSLYLLGAATLVSFIVVILSGVVLALFGPQWWHQSAVGHFFNSVHFWSVQAFFFSMALHLWTTFFMGAWRDGRAKTWMIGVLAFIVSILTAFTGYLSQTNFDSQWIAVSAKDLMNSMGVGGFFNPLNFGQMYTYHIFVFPALVAAIIVLHVLLVRLRGVVRPYPARGEQREAYHKGMTQTEYFRGVRMAPYDLIREVTIIGAVILVLVVVFAGVYSSGDERPLTLQSVAQSDPVGFTTVSLSELDGSSAIAGYGQPYNTATGATQALGPISFQQLGGVTIPVDTAQVYVYGPLATIHNESVLAAVDTYKAASADQQSKWTTSYSDALAKNTNEALDANGALVLPAGDYGPLPTMFNTLLVNARSGSLDGILLASGTFYQTDYTKSLLFLNESALPDKASAEHLAGDQWGMMNEPGAYPGQAWLWLYTLWYQVPAGPFNGPNADVAVAVVMFILTALLFLVPFIPGLESLPRYLRLYRVIWRDHYREMERGQSPSGSGVRAAGGPMARRMTGRTQ